MYCGDETGAFIGDVASHSCRFGYGGEDKPKYVVPSYMWASDRSMPSSSLHYRKEEEDLVPIYRLSKGNSDQVDYYLQQGDVVENWEAWETAWQTSFDVLRVRDTLKHTKGGGGNNGSNSGQATTTRTTGVTSSTVRSSGAAAAAAGSSSCCAHPILAVDAGCTHAVDANNNDSSQSSTGQLYRSALRREQRTKMCEIVMESLDAPAMFVAPTPMLAAFSHGRQTGVVVDIGASGCRVTPVVDGLLLENAQRRNGRGGDWLGDMQRQAILWQQQQQQLDNSRHMKTDLLLPRYMLGNNNKVLLQETQKTRPIFHRWAMQDLMYEMKTSTHVTLAPYRMDWTTPFVYPTTTTTITETTTTTNASSSQVLPTSEEEKQTTTSMEVDDDDHVKVDTPRKEEEEEEEAEVEGKTFYQLPDGTKVDLVKTAIGKDLCRLPELLFTDNVPFDHTTTDASSSSPKILLAQHDTLSNLPLHKLVHASLTAVGDADARKELCGNIILTGASSLYPNLEQRLSVELTHVVPSTYKCRVIASRNSMERRYAAWIGGSVLTSLGSFQQLWLSRTEYDEYGATLGIQRFP